MAVCKGGCKRPAVWRVTDGYDGAVYKTQASTIYEEDNTWCLKHADAEVERLVGLMSQEDRRRLYDSNIRRSDALHPIKDAIYKLHYILPGLNQYGNAPYYKLACLHAEDGEMVQFVIDALTALNLPAVMDSLGQIVKQAKAAYSVAAPK